MSNKLAVTLKNLWLLLVVLIGMGCSIEGENQDVKEVNRGESLNLEESTLDYLKSIGLNTDNYFVEDENVVVEGDIGFPVGNYSGSRHASLGLIVSQDKVSKIRIKTESNVPTGWSNALNYAINDWNEISGTKIGFTRVSSNSAADIVVSYKATTQDYVAQAVMPDPYGNPGKTITINTKYGNYPSGKMRHTMVHEMGHTLGFLHNSDINIFPHVPGTPKVDRTSVMEPIMVEWRGFSNGDIAAARNFFPDGGKYIVIYDEPNYSGRRWVLKVNEGSYEELGGYSFDNQISSIKCFGGAQLALFSEKSSKGDVFVVLDSEPDLRKHNFDNKVSSIRWGLPTVPFVIVYEHANYKGRAYFLYQSRPYVPYDNTMSSIRVFNRARVTLYRFSRYRGRTSFSRLDVPGSMRYIGRRLNDEVSSIKFIK